MTKEEKEQLKEELYKSKAFSVFCLYHAFTIREIFEIIDCIPDQHKPINLEPPEPLFNNNNKVICDNVKFKNTFFFDCPSIVTIDRRAFSSISAEWFYVLHEVNRSVPESWLKLYTLPKSLFEVGNTVRINKTKIKDSLILFTLDTNPHEITSKTHIKGSGWLYILNGFNTRIPEEYLELYIYNYGDNVRYKEDSSGIILNSDNNTKTKVVTFKSGFTCRINTNELTLIKQFGVK
jgi:hypothetical protein